MRKKSKEEPKVKKLAEPQNAKSLSKKSLNERRYDRKDRQLSRFVEKHGFYKKTNLYGWWTRDTLTIELIGSFLGSSFRFEAKCQEYGDIHRLSGSGKTPESAFKDLFRNLKKHAKELHDSATKIKEYAAKVQTKAEVAEKSLFGS